MDERSSPKPPKPSLMVKLPVRMLLTSGFMLPLMNRPHMPPSSTIDPPRGLIESSTTATPAQARQRAPISQGISISAALAALDQKRQPLTERSHVNNDLRAVRVLSGNGLNMEKNMVYKMNANGLLNGRESSLDTKAEAAVNDTGMTKLWVGRPMNHRKPFGPFRIPDGEVISLAQACARIHQATNELGDNSELKQGKIQGSPIHKDVGSTPGYSRDEIRYGRTIHNDILDGVASLSVQDNARGRFTKPLPSRSKSKKRHAHLAAMLKKDRPSALSLRYSKLAPNHTKRASNDTSQMKAGEAKTVKIGYFSLPGEIRNMIMQYALVPGEIFFSTQKQPVDNEGKRLFMPGCQLLATCKQAYLEGHEMYYSNNTFHLAPGPLSVSVDYFGKLRSRHQELIRSISFDMSLTDLTSAVMAKIEKEFTEDSGQSIADAENSVIVCYIQSALRNLWTKKIVAVSQPNAWDTVRIVELATFPTGMLGRTRDWETPMRVLKLEGQGINELLEPIVSNFDCRKRGVRLNPFGDIYYPGWDDKISWAMQSSLWRVESTIERELEQLSSEGSSGWMALKAWINVVNPKIRNVRGERGFSFRETWSKEKGWTSNY